MVTDLGVGDVQIPWLQVTPADADTTATLTVHPPTGDPYEIPATGGPRTPVPDTDPVEQTQRWTTTQPVTYTAPGRWVLHWQVTGTGEGTEDVTVHIAAPPTPQPAISTDPATDIGMIRLLTADLNPTAPLFTDVQLAAFLSVEAGSVKRAAAAALTAVSTSEVLLSRKFSTQDLSVDGPAVAAELRAQAKTLRDQAAFEDAQTATATPVAPMWSFPPANPAWDNPAYW